MADKAISGNFQFNVSLPAATHAVNADGTAIDTQGFFTAMVVVHTGTITDGNHAISLEESDDGVNFTAVAAANLVGAPPTLTNTNNNSTFKFDYLGLKRYLRVSTTVTGAATGGEYGAIIMLSHSRQRPV